MHQLVIENHAHSSTYHLQQLLDKKRKNKNEVVEDEHQDDNKDEDEAKHKVYFPVFYLLKSIKLILSYNS